MPDNEQRALVEGVLDALLDGKKVALDEHLLVENVHDARTLLHEASIFLAECGALLGGLHPGLALMADVLHRVSCERTTQAEGNEEPQTWSNESPFLN